jgi:protein dpy-30
MAVKGLPVRQYMDQTVVPVLREGLRALNDARPHDPLQFLADYLLAARAKAANRALNSKAT